MKTFTLTQAFHGFVRGERTATVEANTLEEAIEMVDYEESDEDIIRDDRKNDDWEVVSECEEPEV